MRQAIRESRAWAPSKDTGPDPWTLIPDEPRQDPLLDPRIVAALERRERERRELERLLEADDCMIGRSLRGRVGTPMGGQGGILPWAKPLYATSQR